MAYILYSPKKNVYLTMNGLRKVIYGTTRMKKYEPIYFYTYGGSDIIYQIHKHFGQIRQYGIENDLYIASSNFVLEKKIDKNIILKIKIIQDAIYKHFKQYDGSQLADICSVTFTLLGHKFFDTSYVFTEKMYLFFCDASYDFVDTKEIFSSKEINWYHIGHYLPNIGIYRSWSFGVLTTSEDVALMLKLIQCEDFNIKHSLII